MGPPARATARSPRSRSSRRPGRPCGTPSRFSARPTASTRRRSLPLLRSDMRRVVRADILPLERYESRRDRVRRRILALKARRRLVLPPHLSLLFENRETVWYQIQEMLRIERIVKPRAVQHEIDTYNALVPRAGCLAATLFIEVPGLHRKPAILSRFVGLAGGDRLWLEAGGERCYARFDESQFSDARIAAVQYLVFE